MDATAVDVALALSVAFRIGTDLRAVEIRIDRDAALAEFRLRFGRER